MLTQDLLSSELIGKMMYPIEMISNFTMTEVGTFYRYIYSIPLNILRENLAYVSIGLYLLWYIKAYLSVAIFICVFNLVTYLPSYLIFLLILIAPAHRIGGERRLVDSRHIRQVHEHPLGLPTHDLVFSVHAQHDRVLGDPALRETPLLPRGAQHPRRRRARHRLGESGRTETRRAARVARSNRLVQGQLRDASSRRGGEARLHRCGHELSRHRGRVDHGAHLLCHQLRRLAHGRRAHPRTLPDSSDTRRGRESRRPEARRLFGLEAVSRRGLLSSHTQCHDCERAHECVLLVRGAREDASLFHIQSTFSSQFGKMFRQVNSNKFKIMLILC